MLISKTFNNWSNKRLRQRTLTCYYDTAALHNLTENIRDTHFILNHKNSHFILNHRDMHFTLDHRNSHLFLIVETHILFSMIEIHILFSTIQTVIITIAKASLPCTNRVHYMRYFWFINAIHYSLLLHWWSWLHFCLHIIIMIIKFIRIYDKNENYDDC